MSLWYGRIAVGLWGIVSILGIRPASAETGGPYHFLMQTTGSLLYTQSQADKLPGAQYSQKFTSTWTGEVDLAALFASQIYLGVAYDLWSTRRSMTLGGVSTSDTLNYQSVGGEIGYCSINPRTFYLFTAGAFYPVVLNIASNSGVTYTPSSPPLSYRARVALGMRFSHTLAMVLSAAYRYAPLGNLSGSGTSYLPGGAGLDLSGPQFGLGLSLLL